MCVLVVALARDRREDLLLRVTRWRGPNRLGHNRLVITPRQNLSFLLSSCRRGEPLIRCWLLALASLIALIPRSASSKDRGRIGCNRSRVAQGSSAILVSLTLTALLTVATRSVNIIILAVVIVVRVRLVTMISGPVLVTTMVVIRD